MLQETGNPGRHADNGRGFRQSKHGRRLQPQPEVWYAWIPYGTVNYRPPMFKYSEPDRATRVGFMLGDAFLAAFGMFMLYGLFFAR